MKLRGILVHKNTIKKKRKSGTAGNFEPKIEIVPLKAGQLESIDDMDRYYRYKINVGIRCQAVPRVAEMVVDA